MTKAETAIALCDIDGQVLTCNAGFRRWVGELAGDPLPPAAPLPALAQFGGVWRRFCRFMAAPAQSEVTRLDPPHADFKLLFQKLRTQTGVEQVMLEVRPAWPSLSHEEELVIGRLIHDFKNQLSGLKLYAAFLKRRFADEAEGVEICEKITRGLNAMSERARLADRLTRPLHLELAATDPVRLIQQVIQDLADQAGASQVELALLLPPSVRSITADAAQLRSAVYALLKRAIQVTRSGGTVRLEISDGEELRLSFSDEGEPLTAQQRAGLFDWLARLASQEGESQGYEETVINLILARRVIEQHGGALAALPGPSGGTVVQVIIPAMNHEAKSAGG